MWMNNSDFPSFSVEDTFILCNADSLILMAFMLTHLTSSAVINFLYCQPLSPYCSSFFTSIQGPLIYKTKHF